MIYSEQSGISEMKPEAEGELVLARRGQTMAKIRFHGRELGISEHYSCRLGTELTALRADRRTGFPSAPSTPPTPPRISLGLLNLLGSGPGTSRAGKKER